jgi:hypothetical protein
MKPEVEEMSKPEMRLLTRTWLSRSYSRSILVIILSVLCIPVFFYQLVPSFTHSADDLIVEVITHFRGSHCTADIGDAQCCALFMEAAPCVDECRKQFVDRETFTLTLEYDQCADTCLRSWEGCTDSMPRGHTTQSWTNRLRI